MQNIAKISETTFDQVKWKARKHLQQIQNRINVFGNRRRMVVRQHLENLVNGGYTVEEIRKELTYINRSLKKSA